ncbi:DUF3793 family protein [Defluviitalea phaphyphila]|uniref:DUF3793 family protein n=1 Tax=Defluviitalea phaphyphila TaxID=1473580 RepID=UPI00073028C6|nr:DUF3793 family protein [Defluviitalea phaphyphila]
MINSFDEHIAKYCSPTLGGLKPSNLFSCNKEQYLNWSLKIKQFNLYSSSNKLCITPVCKCKHRILLLVYNKKLLLEYISAPNVYEFLHNIGYPLNGNIDSIIRHFKKRINQSQCFPHEIGIILGYPLEDVLGFIKHGGKNYKLSGPWKVYGDVEKASKLFEEYKICKERFCNLISKGFTITQLLNVG